MLRFALSSCLILALTASLAAQGTRYTITTIAGIGKGSFAGDGGPAKDADFNSPFSVVRDNNGNLYIADQANNRVRKIDASGTVTTLAGDGTEFFAGNGGAANKASLINPLGVAVASNGDVYIADSRNHAIRKVVSNGNIERVSGDGNQGYYGDGDDDSTTTDPNAVDGRLARPIGMAFDSAGNLYFADSLNHRVRRIDTQGKMKTFAGTGEPGFSFDEVKATFSKLNFPQGIAVDSGGNVYISDGESHIVRKVSPDGIIRTVAGNRQPGYSGDGGKATSASLYYPRGIAVDAAGNLYIADSLNSRIRRVSEDGTITTIAGTGFFGDFGEGGPAEQADLFFPTGVAVGPNGTIYVVDTQNHKIKLLTPRTSAVSIAPSIDANGIITASSFGGANAAAPGSWIEIYGANFASAAREWVAEDFRDGRAPTSLNGVRVTIGGQAAPVSYVGQGQINAQVPMGLGLGPQQVVVSTTAGTATAVLNLNAAQPGLLAPPSLRINNVRYVGALLADGSLAMPANSTLGAKARPAKAGETITLYGIGFGAVTPGIAAGQIPGQATQLTQRTRFYFGQVEAQVTYAGLAPGLVGVYQFNLVVPNIPANNTVSLTYTVADQPSSQSELAIAVSN